MISIKPDSQEKLILVSLLIFLPKRLPRKEKINPIINEKIMIRYGKLSLIPRPMPTPKLSRDKMVPIKKLSFNDRILSLFKSAFTGSRQTDRKRL